MMSQCLGSVNEPEGPLIPLRKPRDLVANPLKSYEFLAVTGSTETWSFGATTKGPPGHVPAHLASGPSARFQKVDATLNMTGHLCSTANFSATVTVRNSAQLLHPGYRACTDRWRG